MNWLSMNDLLEPPYNSTIVTIFKYVQSGRLVPYEEAISIFSVPDYPGKDRMVPRVVISEHRHIVDQLSSARYQAESLRERLSRSDEDILRKDAEWVEAMLRINGVATPDPGPMSERRDEWHSSLAEHEAKVQDLEEFLHPSKMGPLWTLDDFRERSGQAWFIMEACDAVFMGASAVKKRVPKDQVWRDVFAIRDKMLVKGVTLDAIADSHEVGQVFERHKVKCPQLSTIRKRIQGVGRPGAPKKS